MKSLHRWPWTAIFMVVATAPLILAAPHAEAGVRDVAIGSAGFDGVAQLPPFPCPPSAPGHLTCEGTWEGSFTGNFSGLHTTDSGEQIPWSVAFSAPGSARFSYRAILEEGHCGEGSASGTAHFRARVNQAFGVYRDGWPFPTAVVGIDGTFSFDWQRSGDVGTLQATGLSLAVELNGGTWVSVLDHRRDLTTANAVTSFVTGTQLRCRVGAPPGLTGALNGSLSGISVGAG